jgi:hypothetical protein
MASNQRTKEKIAMDKEQGSEEGAAGASEAELAAHLELGGSKEPDPSYARNPSVLRIERELDGRQFIGSR